MSAPSLGSLRSRVGDASVRAGRTAGRRRSPASHPGAASADTDHARTVRILALRVLELLPGLAERR